MDYGLNGLFTMSWGHWVMTQLCRPYAFRPAEGWLDTNNKIYELQLENRNRLAQVRNPRSGKWQIINKDTGEIVGTGDEAEEGIEVAGETD